MGRKKMGDRRYQATIKNWIPFVINHSNPLNFISKDAFDTCSSAARTVKKKKKKKNG
jgi:hypothetical protein